MKRIFFGAVLLAVAFAAFAEPELAKYLENDLELKKLALDVKKAQAQYNQTSIDNGLDITLSTGKATFKFNGDDTSMTFTPSAKLTVPQASNLGLSASSSIKVTNGKNKTADTSLGLSVDIISGVTLSRKLQLTKSERAVLEAKRKLQNRALEAEKAFYTELKALFNTASEITSLQKDLYDDTIDFEEVKAKGYSANSAKYRQAEMKVLSDRHSVETKIHDLEHDCAVFAQKCSTEFAEGTNPSKFLPQQIPQTEPVDIHSFEKSAYTKIEQAEYDHYIADLSRQVEKDFTLSANAGYTFANSSTSFSDSDSKADTVDLGVDATFKGVTVETGAHIPTDGSSPTYSLGATVKPNTFRTSKITSQLNDYNEQQEYISIQSAEDDYDTDVVDRISALNDILWSKSTNTQTYDLYVTLTDDMASLLKQGIIKESEYLNAFANKEQYRFKLLINDIDLIIYNNETKLLFCRDAEL